jgi:enoyl-CoA hydratase/carnithine racemase
MSQDSESFQKLSEFPLPVVAAIRGVCIGSGLELALACHYRVCDKHATMGLVESTFGFMPGCGGTQRLPALVGIARGLEMILTGERFSSDEALALRIVNSVVHHSELLPKAIGYIRTMAPFYRARHEAGPAGRN